MEFENSAYLSDGRFYYSGIYSFYGGRWKEAFWFPLAAGTIGGLVMSILGIFLFLPIFSLKKQKDNKGFTFLFQ